MTVEPKVSVVIPFFQRQPGILLRALASVLAQNNFTNFEVVVVDDESPIAATSELDRIDAGDRRKIRVIRQSNRGPGGARNTGLDQVAEDTEFIAFIDSDDTWVEDHLSRAVAALERGFDLYISDSGERDVSSHLAELDHGLLGELAPIDEAGELFVHTGDPFAHIVSKNFVCPSSVVFRRRGLSDLRFNEKIWTGEDRLFWIDIISRTDKLIVSKKAEVFMGEGVSIYRSILFGSDKKLKSLVDQIAMRKEVRVRHRLGEEVLAGLNRQISELREDFALNCLHMLSTGRMPRPAPLAGCFVRDPALLFSVPRASLRAVAGRFPKLLRPGSGS